jgi:LysR family transcriptional regulator, glycine cleavage system transcriptional activator
MPPLEWLRGFEACARLASFSRAAEEIGITQAAMSLRIRDLEARLGARLFHRTRPRVSLTREGVRLAAQVRAPFEDLRGVFEKRGTRDRAVKVTAAPTFGKRWLPPRIPRFLALYPDVTIEIEASVDLRSIEGREFNVGVRSGYGQWPGLIAHELVPVYRAPMLSPLLAKSLGGISRAEDLLRAPLLWEAAWQDWFKAAGIGDWSSARRLRMSFETQDVLADVAQTGAGVALLSPFIFRDEITAKRLICPVGPTLPGPENFYVVYDPSRRDSARDLFIGWLRATVAAEMALPPPNGIPIAQMKTRRPVRRR